MCNLRSSSTQTTVPFFRIQQFSDVSINNSHESILFLLNNNRSVIIFHTTILKLKFARWSCVKFPRTLEINRPKHLPTFTTALTTTIVKDGNRGRIHPDMHPDSTPSSNDGQQFYVCLEILYQSTRSPSSIKHLIVSSR